MLQIGADEFAPPGCDLTQHYAVLKELGDCYADMGDYDRARGCYLEAAELEPRRAGPHLGIGVVEVQLGPILSASNRDSNRSPALIKSFQPGRGAWGHAPVRPGRHKDRSSP